MMTSWRRRTRSSPRFMRPAAPATLAGHPGRLRPPRWTRGPTTPDLLRPRVQNLWSDAARVGRLGPLNGPARPPDSSAHLLGGSGPGHHTTPTEVIDLLLGITEIAEDLTGVFADEAPRSRHPWRLR